MQASKQSAGTNRIIDVDRSQIRHDSWRGGYEIRCETVQAEMIELGKTSITAPFCQSPARSTYLLVSRRRRFIDSIDIPLGDLIGCDTHTLPLSTDLEVMLFIVELVEDPVISRRLGDKGLVGATGAA